MPEGKKQTKLEKDTEELFDFAVQSPQGFTYDDIEPRFGWEKPYFFRVVRQVRLLFESDQINLVCAPRGTGAWLYQLVGRQDDAREWARNRERDMESRLVTMAAVAQSIVNSSDGRSKTGRRARLVHATLTALLAQLEAMEGALDSTAS